MAGTGRLVVANCYVVVLTAALASTGAPAPVLWTLVGLHIAITLAFGAAASRSRRRATAPR